MSVRDVAISGTVHRIAGSEDETGGASLAALSSGESSVDLNLPSGPLRASRLNSGGSIAGHWTGRDGVSHSVPGHNLMSPSSWFFPAFAIGAILSDENYVITLVGQEDLNDKPVYHVRAYRLISTQSPAVAELEQHLTEVHIFLDTATSLPIELAFNEHPDDNAQVDIPNRIEFSDYRSVWGGAAVPHHVQRFINNSLVLDLQFESVKFNTGLALNSSGTQ